MWFLYTNSDKQIAVEAESFRTLISDFQEYTEEKFYDDPYTNSGLDWIDEIFYEDDETGSYVELSNSHIKKIQFRLEDWFQEMFDEYFYDVPWYQRPYDVEAAHGI